MKSASLLLFIALLFLGERGWAETGGLCDFNSFARNVFLKGQNYQPTLKLFQKENFAQDWKKYVSTLNGNKDKDWFYANLFFDRDVLATNKLRESDKFLGMWDEGFLFKFKPLKNFEETFDHFILESKNVDLMKDFNLDLLSDFNGSLMKGSSEAHELGKPRNYDVYYSMDQNDALKYEGRLKNNELLEVDSHFKNGLKDVAYPPHAQVKPLMEKAFQDFREGLSAAKNLEERVRVYTDFTKKMITIHPFGDGNGRTTRFTLNYLLCKEGLPPVILEDTIDLSVSNERFYEKVINGVKSSHMLMDDIAWRKAHGLEIRKSPYNLTAKLPEKIWFKSKGMKEKGSFPMDAYDYAQFVRNNKKGYQSSAFPESDQLRDYTDWVKKWSVQFVKKGHENDLYQVKRVPEEMMELSKNANQRLKTKESLEAFYQKFYEKDEIHRGLGMQESLTDPELLDHFRVKKGIHESMSGNAQQDYANFNGLMEQPDRFFKYADDHMNATGIYNRSVFASTSKTTAVAKRFSKGFLMDPASIKEIKGQMIVSALTPKYGAVDFNRLSEISEKASKTKFYSKYPRQQEVSIAGGITPSSVTRVEFHDVKIKDAVQNTGEWIAGETEVTRTRILERLQDDPSKVKFTTLGPDGKVISEKTISLY